jgi:hypothetical protein
MDDVRAEAAGDLAYPSLEFPVRPRRMERAVCLLVRPGQAAHTRSAAVHGDAVVVAGRRARVGRPAGYHLDVVAGAHEPMSKAPDVCLQATRRRWIEVGDQEHPHAATALA